MPTWLCMSQRMVFRDGGPQLSTFHAEQVDLGTVQMEGTPSGSCGVLAAVQGGGFAVERQRSAVESAKRQGLAGFALNGLGTGETPEQRLELMQSAAAELPQDLPRFLLAGAGIQVILPVFI